MSLQRVEVKPVPHTVEAATALADAARADVVRGYETAREVFEQRGFVISEDHDAIAATHIAAVTAERTFKNIGNNPGQYFEAQIDGEEVAYTRLATFKALDLAPYKSGVSEKVLKLVGKTKFLRILSPLFGMHGLYPSTSERSVVDHERGYNALIGKAIELAGTRPIYINVQDGDLVTDVLLENDFEPTGQYSEGVINALELPQQLYIRRPN